MPALHRLKEIYLVNITILEGRHFICQNMNSFVHIKVGNTKKITKVKKNTDCPYYNEYFVFEFVTNMQDFLDMNICFTVYRAKSTWRSKKIMGFITLDVATVWEQPDHQFYRKWAILNSPKAELGGPRGYLKVTISILMKGQSPNIPLVNENDDEIEGHLLLPEGITLERQKALYVFKIYRGVDIIKSNNEVVIMEDETKPAKTNELPSSYIQITFAGLTARTKTKRNDCFPVWNESLTIAELFPPLSHKIKVQLHYNHQLHKKVRCKKYLKISSISSDSVDGFLPTFGPSYVHFYKAVRNGEEFVGKVLMCLETKLHSELQTKTRCVIKDSIPPILESTIWRHENIVLFIVIMSATAIDKGYGSKQISFEAKWGRVKVLQIEDAENIIPEYHTPAYNTYTTDNHFWSIDFEEALPCLNMVATYPNAKRRFYNANLIAKLAKNTRHRLDKIEQLFIHDDFTSHSLMIEENLIELFAYVSRHCAEFIDIVAPTVVKIITELDREKVKMCLREMDDISDICKTAYNSRSKKKSFRRAEKIYRRIETLIDHPQECWPDVFLWMKYGGKKVSCLKVPAKKLIFSEIEPEKGTHCGEVTNYYFPKPKKSKSASPTVCKIEAYMWLGVQESFGHCLSLIPQCYKLPENVGPHEIPRVLNVGSSMTFCCRAHIYQGRFLLAFDKTGLSDFYARVLINEQSKRTKVKYATLNPLWDQTLSFQDVVIYGDKAKILAKPPVIIVEIMDHDKCWQFEYVGRSILKPIIKFKEDSYSPPNFPPKLEWHEVRNGDKVSGEILAVVELLEQTADIMITKFDAKLAIGIPDDIKPLLFQYRMEVLFWGLRDMRKVNGWPILRPKVCVECGEIKLSSETISSHKFLNFTDPLKHTDLILPNSEELVPPLSIKLYDCKTFGRCIYMGNQTLYVQKYIYHPITREEWDKRISGFGVKSYESMLSEKESVHTIDMPSEKYYDKKNLSEKDKKKAKKEQCCLKRCFKFLCRKREKDYFKNFVESEEEEEDEDTMDWWTKYYSSLESISANTTIFKRSPDFKLKIYENELEKQAEFSGFQDILTKFKIFRGKTIGDDLADQRSTVAILKCKIRMYLWPQPDDVFYVTPKGHFLANGFFQGSPTNVGEDFVVRVYCIRGIKLTPKDVSGKCDPYIMIRMNDIVIDDSRNYMPRNVNPVFGRAFELKGSFPKDYSITVAVWDWDRNTQNDLIGETRIDIENRLYTKHRAHCGIQYEFKDSGPTPWRDQLKPKDILEKLCKNNSLLPPEYIKGGVLVGCKFYSLPEIEDPVKQQVHHVKNKEELLALHVLHRWHEMPLVGCHLVPEHVETRSLYHPSKPGIEQGKIQLWIDVFPSSGLPAPCMVKIAPRKPVSYELRVIIWNTDDVVLNESDFFGDRKSDIYVKGWLSRPDRFQATDVHYRSLTGEGNFNWRFIFYFDYLSTENKIMYKKKDHAFDLDETETKVPCKLKLQVWDNDIFSHDDFLGSMTLDLSCMPRGAKISGKCSLRMLDPRAPKMNLFKIKRTRGWWPFTSKDKVSNKTVLSGKLEAEFDLLPADEAAAQPAGLGRSEPEQLPPPKRPESSFSWISNPLKTCRFIVWKNMKWKCLKCIVAAFTLLFFALAIYNLPGYSVKKLLHV